MGICLIKSKSPRLNNIMKLILKEYGTAIITCIITILLIILVINGGVGSEIGALSPTIIKKNVQSEQYKNKNIPKYNQTRLNPFGD